MASDVTLSSAQRQTLLSLKNISKLSDRTQVRLATGREINNVTDGAEAFFASRTLQNRAGVFADRRETIDQGVSTIQAAIEGIDALDELLGQLRGLARQARSQTADERAETTESFREVIDQFSNLLADTSYQGLNLLDNQASQLTVEFSDRGESDLTIQGVDILATAGGRTAGAIFNPAALRVAGTVDTAATSVSRAGATAASRHGFLASNLLYITNGFAAVTATAAYADLAYGFSVLSIANNLESLSQLDERLSDAQDNLQTRAGSLGNNVALLQTRLDFTDGLINHLVTGSDKIINADLNEEAANLTATGTQYQIGVQSLGVSGQRVQALLQVIR